MAVLVLSRSRYSCLSSGLLSRARRMLPTSCCGKPMRLVAMFRAPLTLMRYIQFESQAHYV